MERQVIDNLQILSQKQTQEQHVQIIISVLEPFLQEKDAFNYFTYNVSGKDRHGTFSVRRRYSDFDLLRKKLSERIIGIYLPPLPGKRAEKNPLYFLTIFQSKEKEIKYAQRRCKFLKYFCQGIAVRPYLYEYELFQIFIRGETNYEAAIQSCIIKEYKFTLRIYEQSCRALIQKSQKEYLQQQISASQHHLQLLRHYQNTLVDACSKINQTSLAREQFNKQFNSTMKKTIPDYEEKYLLIHVNRNREKLVLNRNQQFSVKLANFQKINSNNPLQKFTELLTYQIREIKAFIQAIEGRKEAEKLKIGIRQKIAEKQNLKQKILNGMFSFRVFFKTGSKQHQLDELKRQLQALQNELVCLQRMIVLMIISTNFEIQQYRKRNQKQFIQVFRKVSQQELAQINALKQLLDIPLAKLQ